MPAPRFQFSPNLLSQIASGGQFQPGQAMLQGLQLRKQYEQQALENQMAQEQMQMREREFGLREETLQYKLDKLKQDIGSDPRILSREETLKEGFSPGTVVEKTDSGYDVLQESEDEDKDGWKHIGPMVDQQGEYIGERWSKNGQSRLEKFGSGQYVPVPEGAVPTTATGLDRESMTPKQFNEIATEAHEYQRSIRSLERYWGSVKDSKQGIALLADKFIAQAKTVFGSAINDQEEFNALVASGQLEGLLGLFREEVVGGGVMTEYDAERVIRALGGNVSLFQNEEVVQKLLSDLLYEKVTEYNERIVPTYNKQASIYEGFDPIEKIDFDKSQLLLEDDIKPRGELEKGDIVDGMRYKGKEFDPSDPKSWEEIK